MAGLLAAAMVVVTLYCLARALLPGLRPTDHGRALDWWHAVMAGAMAAMLLLPLGTPLSVVGVVVFVAGLGWALSHAVRRAARSAYLGVGAGCAAMAVMLLPATTAEAVPATGAAAAPGMHHSHATASATAVPMPLLLGVLLVALSVVLAVRLVESLLPALPVPTRLDACCDVAMAVAMVYMLGLMV